MLCICIYQQGETNYFSALTKLKDQHGQPLFHSILLGLVCERCQAEGKACTHKLDLNPQWKPVERMMKTDAIYATNPKLRDREQRGIICSDMVFLVSERQVQEFRARPPVAFPAGSPDVVFLAVDPSGGGEGSKWAICALTIFNMSPVVRAQARRQRRSGSAASGS